MNAKAAIAGGVAALALAAGGTTAAVVNLTGGGCGSDVCPGDSWSAAYVAASPGQVLTVGDGTYPTQTILDAGKTGAAVTFQGDSGVVVSGDLTLGSTSACNGSDHIVFKGITVQGQPTTRCGTTDITLQDVTASGVNIGGGSDIHVIGGSYGPSVNNNSEIKNGATNVTIEGAVFHDYLTSYALGATRPHTECIQIWGSGVKNLLIHNTIFRNCTDFGILVKGTGFDGVHMDASFFEAPMPGNFSNGTANGTVLCNPNCPRGGSSIRFSDSTVQYPNSSVTNNVINGGLTIDCKCVTTSGNGPGTIPDVPPGTTTTTTTTTTTEPTSTTTTTESTTTTTDSTTTAETTTTEPPPDSLPLTVVASTATTVTVGWTPQGDQGYRFLVDGVSVSNTNDPTRSSAKFSKKTGAVIKVIARSEVASGTVVQP